MSEAFTDIASNCGSVREHTLHARCCQLPDILSHNCWMKDWVAYQEEVAGFFRDLGMESFTDVTVKGARTSHDVDVVVRGRYSGFDIMWVVECKAWAARIPKEKVLALRTIVADTGADRGFLMAESGYQSGALEAALLANITLTSVGELKERLRYELAIAKLNKLENRADECRERYWRIDKTRRIECGLRPEVYDVGYSGTNIIAAVEEALRSIRLRGFPVTFSPVEAVLASFGGRRRLGELVGPGHDFDEPEDLYEVLDAELTKLEALLTDAEG